MRKTLYLLTMLFNALGILCSLSLFIFASQFSFQNLFLVLSGSAIFTISFMITMLDYNNSRGKNIYRKVRYVSSDVDYKEYFLNRKSDFLIRY